MKGRIPEQSGLVDFVCRVVAERHHPEAEMRKAMEDSENEMLQNGIVAVGDICNSALTIPLKKKERLRYYNFIEASGWLPSVSRLRFERAKQLYDEFTTQLSSASQSIVPHAAYSVSAPLWEEIHPFFENRVLSIHNQETASENEFFLHGTGEFLRMFASMKIENSHHQPTKRTSLPSYFGRLAGASNAILVHNSFTSQEDLDYVKVHSTAPRPDIYFCLCVNANQYIENAVPPIELLRNNACTLVLGTDSLASNWSLNLLDEIRSIKNVFPHIGLDEILQWATRNGARALQMEDRLGSFDKGKEPGILLIDESTLAVKRLF